MKFNIEVYWDMLCPWCFIGKRTLERAMAIYREEMPDAEYEVVWKPFYLSPGMKKSGYSKREFYESRVGTEQYLSRLQAAGVASGIRFAFTGRTGNTRDAHKLAALALHHGPMAQGRVVEALMRGHFETGRDISDLDFLVDVAQEAGLGLVAEDVVDWLESPAAAREVDGEVARARSLLQVSAVPSFTVQGKWRIGGYQGVEVFVELFRKIAAQNNKEVSLAQMEVVYSEAQATGQE